MNIIYINHYAGSPEMGMEFRPYYLAKEWVKMGHKVIIIAGDYSHLRIKNPTVDKDFKKEIIDGIEYRWVKSGKYSGNGINRAFSMFRFVKKLVFNAKRIAKRFKPDIVIASSTYPLDTFSAQRIARYSGAKYVHEVHDMWPITLIEIGGMKKYHPFVILMQIAENSFCKHSDYIVSLLCAAKDYFINHGMSSEKFKVVMNGIVKEEWDNPQSLPVNYKNLIDQLHNEGKFIICFFGSVTKSYAIDYLVKAHQKLNNNKIALLIVGEGNYKERLMDMAGDNVFFLSSISKTAIPDLLYNIDCCYVGALHNDMFRFGICMNKLFDSMMSGKPILYAVDAPNNFITDYCCGISVEPENVDSLMKGMQDMVLLSDKERKKMGDNGRNAVINNYTYSNLAKKFLNDITS